MTIIYALLVFLLVIMVHEFGHFIVAKLNNIKVNEFSIGMGPAIFKKQGKETLYAIRALPVGGYVALEGEEDDSVDPRSFSNAHPLKKISVLVAGAVMNFILALVLGVVVFSTLGQQTTTIDSFVENSTAQAAGLEAGDKILYIDDQEIKTWPEISQTLNSLKKGQVTIKVQRDKEELVFQVPTKEENGHHLIGIYPTLEKNFTSSLGASFEFTKDIIKQVYIFMGQLLTGRAKIEGLSGPVGIVRMIGESAEQGFINVLMFACMISANLGAFNLFPFPALDGGTIVITLIEWIAGKKLPEKARIAINSLGLIFLFGLIGYVTIFNDIL